MIAHDDASIHDVHTDIRWHFHPRAESLREVLTHLALDEWLKEGRASIVKQGPHRIVYRLTIDGDVYFLKRHLMPDVRTRLRQCIRPAKAFMEYERAERVAGCGIATVQPAAWGTGPGGESYLLTHGLDDVVPLSEFLIERLRGMPRREQARRRLRLARELGRFVARVHDAGITHDDFHAGNILVRDEPGRHTLFLLDLDAAHLGRPLDERARRANLATLHLWFLARASRTDRQRFLHAYLAECGHARPRHEARRIADALEASAWDFARAFWRDRDERCTKSNRYYQCVRRGSIVGHALANFDPDVLAPILADPEEPFRRPGVVVLKESRSSKVVSLDLELNGIRQAFVYKRFTCKGVWKSIGHALHASPALHSWIQGHGFHERGLPTARPVLILQRRRFGLVCDGYLLAEKIEHAVSLHEFLERLRVMPREAKQTRLRTALATVGKTLRMLHERHYSHRDLKANNLLLADPACGVPKQSRDWQPQVPPGIWFIDLVGAKLTSPSESARMRNLARLNASFHESAILSRTDRLRVLRAYFAAQPSDWVHWKRWWRTLARVTAQKIERNRRIGRDLG